MIRLLRERQEWKFFSVLPKADATPATAWWIVLLLRGVLPAVFAAARVSSSAQCSAARNAECTRRDALRIAAAAMTLPFGRAWATTPGGDMEIKSSGSQPSAHLSFDADRVTDSPPIRDTAYMTRRPPESPPRW